MPTKFQLITELYDQTVQSVTGSYQSWTGFLRAACYNYKCPFDDQILIYAQRPDATAVLEMERWNRQFGRWVNRGAKSIAVKMPLPSGSGKTRTGARLSAKPITSCSILTVPVSMMAAISISAA